MCFRLFKTQLNQLAKTVRSPVSESAVVMIQVAKKPDLATFEKGTVRGLQLVHSAVLEASPVLNSIVWQAMKQLKASFTIAKSEYQDTHYLHPTSYICKQMFAIAGPALISCFQWNLFRNFESRLFSYMNQNI